MRTITFFTTTVFSLFVAVGCGSKGGAEGVKKMNGYADEMCKCTTSDCATKVNEQMTKWMQEQATAKTTATADEAKALTTASARYAECATKAMTAAPPPSDPPPAEPAGSAEAPKEEGGSGSAE